MSITATALDRSRFTLAAAFALVLAGIGVLFGFPSTEEPTVPVRTATVQAFWPGASPERQEALVAHPLEEVIREVPEVEHIDTIIRPGFTLLYVNLRGNTAPEKLPVIWQQVKAKVAQAALPEGVTPPQVNDEYGRVAVRSLALTGPNYSAGQLQDWAKKARERLQGVSGVQAIALYGVREDRVYVELSPDRLAAAGVTPQVIAQALRARNVLTSAGEIEVQGKSLALAPSGDLPSVADLAAVPIVTPNSGTLPLSALGKIVQRAEDPPLSAVLFNGEPAVVLGVSMLPGLNVGDFAERLNVRLADIEKELPYGMHLASVTDQSIVVATQLGEVGRVFLETVVIVLAVVVGFLGWRAGLVTGLIVPVTVLGALAIMRAFGIELHQVSIAAIIISLGLFVDNAIVVVEDFQRRVAGGEARHDAAVAAGKDMAAPLLTSTSAIILSFVPLVSGQNSTAEYMRSLGFVVAITLLLSLLLALTFTPLLAKLQPAGGAHHGGEAMIARVRAWYAERVRAALRHPFWVIGTMAATLAVSVVLYGLLPQELLSSSERAQLQMSVELDPGTSTRQTADIAAKVSRTLADRQRFPELTGNAIYVGDGGPRFILGLNPPAPAANRAYAVINLAADADREAAVDHIRNELSRLYPMAKFEPKRFSLGASEVGKAVFRLVGPDRTVLADTARKLMEALRRDHNVHTISTTLEGSSPYLTVDIDAPRAAQALVSNADIAGALDAAYSGMPATVLRQGNAMVPVIVRAPDSERFSPERLSHLPVSATTRLGDVAALRLADQTAVLNRRDMFPSVEVSAFGSGLTAQDIVDRMQLVIAKLGLPKDTVVEYGGELADSVEANQGLQDYLPLAVLGMAGLFLWQFRSFRKTLIILVSIPFVVIGACAGLWLTGQPVSFSATLGLLALGGIIVNNAVLLLERIQFECNQNKPLAQAIADAAVLRLRPIMMTMLTCVLGLVPLFAFGGPLWRPLAATMIGGLALGTLITLVLVPSLYFVAFRWNGVSRLTGENS
jgi:multidrug efflux pump subunit AcrB